MIEPKAGFGSGTPDPAKIRRILVRANNWIGDVVMISPAIRALRERFPGAEISILARPWVCDALTANPFFDTLIPYEIPGRHEGVLGRMRLIADLRRRSFDLAVLFQKAFEAAFLAAAAGIPIRVGHATDRRSFLLTDCIPVTESSRLRHHVDFFLEVAEACGCHPSSRQPFFSLAEEDRAWADRFLRSAHASTTPPSLVQQEPRDGLAPPEGSVGSGSDVGTGASSGARGATGRSAETTEVAGREYRSESPLVAIHPGGSKAPRAWHTSRFAELAATLHKSHALVPLIVGDANDAAAGEEIARRVPSTLVSAGRTTVRQMAALIERSRLFVGSDSGPMHIAGALGTPAVGIFGPGTPEKTAPRTDLSPFEAVTLRFACSPCRQDFFRECDAAASGKPFCLEGIQVDVVAAACSRVLAASAS